MSLNDRLAAFFKAHPRTWHEGQVLGGIAGKYAWRSRVSDCRLKLGMDIRNIQVRHYRHDRGCLGEFNEKACSCGTTTVAYVESFYRYEPPAETKPSALQGHDLNTWSLR